MQHIMGKVRAALDQYEMLQSGDHLAVGVSGGKDSLVLLCALAQLKEYYPKKFQLTALTADPCFGGKETDYSPIASLCRDLQIPYFVRTTNLGTVIFEERQEKNPCSLCARMRRGILHNMALEAGCNKLALGHHFDDAVQTFFMNLFYGGRLGCFSPVSYLSRKKLYLIRPLIFCEEKEIASAARRHDLPIIKSACPMDGITCRSQTDQIITALEKEFPDLRQKVMGALQRARLDGWGKPEP